MDDAVRGGRSAAQAVGVLEGVTAYRDSSSSQGRGGLLRAGEADDLMPGIDEFANDGGTDVSGAAASNITRSKRKLSLRRRPGSDLDHRERWRAPMS